MAYYSIFPEKDTTLYSHPNRSTMNAGNDEILELVKEKGNTNHYTIPQESYYNFLIPTFN